jgi:hypothetical protein
MKRANSQIREKLFAMEILGRAQTVFGKELSGRIE